MTKDKFPSLEEQQKMLADLQHSSKVLGDVLLDTIAGEGVTTEEELDAKAAGLVTALGVLRAVEQVYTSNIEHKQRRNS